jgi:nicotinamide N-methyltransferase
MSDYMIQDEIHIDKYLREKRVLEFGAGGSVPSLVAGVVNAQGQVDRKGKGKGRVISTDYPDDSLLENIRGNVRRNGLEGSVEVEGFVWGRKCDGILEHLKGDNVQQEEEDDDLKFDTLLLSDLIFNHSQHIPLIHSMMHLIRPHTGRALVFHSHHLPQWRRRDLHFFRLAKNRGFSVTKVLEEKRGVQFEKDAGDKEVRERVWGWELKWDGVMREEDSDLEDLDGKPDGS